MDVSEFAKALRRRLQSCGGWRPNDFFPFPTGSILHWFDTIWHSYGFLIVVTYLSQNELDEKNINNIKLNINIYYLKYLIQSFSLTHFFCVVMDVEHCTWLPVSTVKVTREQSALISFIFFE